MTRTLTAYMPLSTYPEAAPDDAIRSAVGFAAGLGLALRVTTFVVDVPQVTSPFGNMMLDVKGMVRAAEEKSRAEGQRLQDLVRVAAEDGAATVSERVIVLGGALDAAAREARYCDLSVVPWAESGGAQDMAQSLVFGSGRPTIIVPPSAQPAALEHIAVAWDGSLVAARAMNDALALLAPGGRVSVLTVVDEKPLGEDDLAGLLAAALTDRGYEATPVRIALEGRKIAEALQQGVVAQGAQMLAMGGFGHSRFRDFILGGATLGVLDQLSVPVLLSH